MKIGVKILVMILTIALLTLLTISAVSYTQMQNLAKYSQDANIQLGITASEKSKKTLLQESEDYLLNIAAEQASATDAVLLQVNDEVTAMADYISRLYANMNILPGKKVPSPSEVKNGVAGGVYMLAPGVKMTGGVENELRILSNAEYMFGAIFESNDLLNNTYLGTENGIFYRYSRSNLDNKGFDPRQRDWYTTAMKTPNQAIWLDTYLDVNGDICVTCARAFTDENGEVSGVVGTDVTLGNLMGKILSLKIGEEGYAFLLNSRGDYIAHPLYGEKRFGAPALDDASSDSWRKALESILAGKYGTSIAEVDGQERYIVSSAVSPTGWILCVTIPIEEVVTLAEETRQEINASTSDAQQYIRKTLSDIIMRFIVIFAVIAIIVIAFSFLLSRMITRPIEDLTKKVRQIGSGDLGSGIEVRGKDEIAELAASFNVMTADLKDYIKNLETVTMEKERINSELNVAASIQEGMLPRIFPKFAIDENISIFAKMTPAKYVGGDFYDFFYVGKNNESIAFVIADVSGKGVPASLFMVIAKTLIKTHVTSGISVTDSLARVNNILCEDNPSNMFVTLFLCVLDIKTGVLSYSNAGHNKPLISINGKPYEFMDVKHGLPIGVRENTEYHLSETRFGYGDKLYLYTDGINEAESVDGEFFGNDRLLQVANANRDLPPEMFDDAMRAAVTAFAGGAEQSDDITTLAFERLKPSEGHEAK
jgi:sigma-B regulation protein RsbU (phosphoserine phosphatase)